MPMQILPVPAGAPAGRRLSSTVEPAAPIWASTFLDRLIDPLADLVLVHPRVLRRELPSATRGGADVVLARQIVMYLLVTRCGLSMKRAGGLVGRDRTTVSHAARTIEDRRDDRAFDRALAEIETALPFPVFPPLAEPATAERRAARAAAIAAALGLPSLDPSNLAER